MSKLRLVSGAAGASRLLLTPASGRMVSEHRAWLDEVYGVRAAEAPGLVKLLEADGHRVAAASGWALGPPLADGRAAWIEEVGEEYRYRVARSDGAGAALLPEGDYWVVVAAVGHPTSPLAAVVLWRPAPGASPRDPASRRDQLWIAAIDRAKMAVVATRELELTLPDLRADGVVVGGTGAAPRLLLVGLPDPGGPGAYRAVGLGLPGLEVVFDAQLDVAGPKASPPARDDGGRAAAPAPRPATADAASRLRLFSTVLAAPLGDGSGFVIAHGARIRAIHGTEVVFVVGSDGGVVPMPALRLRDASHLGPVEGQPAISVLGMAGARNDQGFAAVDVIWPREGRSETLVDLRTRVDGRTLAEDPHLRPIAVAVRHQLVMAALPAPGDGLGAEGRDVHGLTTTPLAWHRDDRPRVIARKAWLDARARP